MWLFPTDPSDTAQDGSWSLTHLPEPDSPIVLQQKNELQSLMDIHQLDKTFHLLGSLSGIAFYAAVGYADHNLQQQIKSFYKDVNTLHETFSTTFDGFVSSSEEALGELSTAFTLLMQGEREQAVSALEEVSNVGQHLAQAASALQSEASSSEDKVVLLLDSTRRAKSKYEIEKQDHEEKRRALQVEKDRTQKQQQNAAAAAKEAKRRADDAQREADKERKKKREKNKGIMKVVNKVLDDVFNIERLKKHEKREKAARHEQRLHEEKVKAQQALYQQAEQKLKELEGQLQRSRGHIDLMNEAVESLHAAVGEFLSLSVIMRDATAFWQSIHDHCMDLVKSLTLTETEMAANSAKVWESTHFQSRAVRLYAKWLALELQSSYYLQINDGVRGQIASLVSAKQPTVEEARNRVKQLKEGRKRVKDEL